MVNGRTTRKRLFHLLTWISIASYLFLVAYQTLQHASTNHLIDDGVSSSLSYKPNGMVWRSLNQSIESLQRYRPPITIPQGEEQRYKLLSGKSSREEEIFHPFDSSMALNLSSRTGESHRLHSPTTYHQLSDKEQPEQHHHNHSHWPRPYEPSPRPPLTDLVQGWNVTSDPQWLLNFAIAGFPKCGTSSLMHFFHQKVPEVQIFAKEECSMSGNQYAPLMERLYQELPAGDYVRGLKCPRELESNNVALPNYAKYFPKTDFIVGVRHPVLWFESFYNHRIHNGNVLAPPNQLLGACRKGSRGVCGDRAKYHWWLVWLHKTNMTTEAEQSFFPRYQRRKNFDVGWKGRVFLYEVTQLRDGGTLPFRRDLQRFLYLKHALPSISWFRPGNKNYTSEEVEVINAKKMDICHDNYTDVRQELVQIGTQASTWISEFFLSSPDVVISPSHKEFRNYLQAWQRDPCRDTVQAHERNVSHQLVCTREGCVLPKAR